MESEATSWKRIAKVYADEEMKELDYNLLLVLQRKSEKP